MRHVLLLGSASVCALLSSTMALAQSQPVTPPAAAAEPAGEIVVTGSRIAGLSYDAPTPTTTLSGEMIKNNSQPNIFNTLAQLPALQGSTGSGNFVANGNTSIGDNGLSALNLRGLGTIRTLTLLDGQRVVPAYITGIVDVSQFPQLLIKKVDVVTGGASASWGSDAVAGVVNFVTDTRFTGFKANFQGGVSTYGDDKNGLAQLAYGKSLLDDRLHIQVSGEFYHNGGIPGGDVGGKMPNGRPDNYRSNTTSYSLAGTPAGSPQYYNYPYNAQDTSFSRYGLITAGPLRGTAFDAGGNVTAFQYGSGCVGTVCQGGDQTGYISNTTTVDDPMRRIVGYFRAGYDLTDSIELYTTVNVSELKISNSPVAYPRRAGISISCANAYLPASVTAGCAANGITSFTYGTTNSNFPARENIENRRFQTRFVGGAKGDFQLFGKKVKFDSYFEHGSNTVDIDIHNMILLPRYNAAINAVRNSSGQIVCGSAVAVAEGCQPINIFGGTPVSSAAYNWIAPANGPHQHTAFTEDAGAVSFNVTPMRNWAGDISVAFGGEWRSERYKAQADAYGAGTTSASPSSYDANYPADPLLSTAGRNWFAGNYNNGAGSYNVKEGFLEVSMPLWDSQQFGKFNLDVGGRIADYSTAGVAKTWKIGGAWTTPLEGLRLRGVVSRDIRAPNLSELYAAPLTSTIIVTDRTTNQSVQVLSTTVGNTALKPEVSNSHEFGLVYRPAFAKKLIFSVDYFSINLKGAISSLTAQQIIDLCYNGNKAFCGGINLTGTIGTANSPYVTVQPFNLASLKERGIDFELGYRFDLGSAGHLDLHALATHTISYTSDPGVAGQIIQQLAGSNSTDTPYWKGNLTQVWTQGALTVTLGERLISAGKINPNYITCTSNCPASTVQNPTTNFNHIPGAVYVDLGGTYQLRKGVELYGRIDNIGNVLAPAFGSSTIYDVIGRTFRLGARLSL